MYPLLKVRVLVLFILYMVACAPTVVAEKICASSLPANPHVVPAGTPCRVLGSCSPQEKERAESWVIVFAQYLAANQGTSHLLQAYDKQSVARWRPPWAVWTVSRASPFPRSDRSHDLCLVRSQTRRGSKTGKGAVRRSDRFHWRRDDGKRPDGKRRAGKRCATKRGILIDCCASQVP